MKSLAAHDRPREKLGRLGPSGLGDNELLAVLLGHGYRRTGALELANELLEAVGGLHRLTRMSPDDLRRVKGVGATKASQILAAIELGRRTLIRVPRSGVQCVTPRDVAGFLLPQYGSKPVEQFGILLFDTKYRVLRTSVLSVGILDGSLVHPREVFREAAGAGAAAIVLFHNHPSGDPKPSQEDDRLTRRMVQAGQLMGIEVLDHVILADARYYSFKEAGLI